MATDHASEPIPSPVATGGGGGLFEERLDAYALALLLARSSMPLAPECGVLEVHFQTRHRGWRTDDLLIVGRAGPDRTSKLAIQAKRQFTVAASDEECVQTVRSMWDDFTAADRFAPETDRLAVATLHGTRTLLSAFNSLLDCAKAAATADDFGRRSTVEGYLSKKARSQNEVLRDIIAEHAPESFTDEAYWRFLRVLNVLSMDLGTETSHTEALVIALLRHTASGPGDPLVLARATWHALLELASEARPAAASFVRDDLPEELLQRHPTVPEADERARCDLVEHGRFVREQIRGTLGGGWVLDRRSQIAFLRSQIEAERIVVVSGTAGAGKSALVKSLLERVDQERPVLAFQAVEFATSHINHTLSRTQSALTATGFFALLAAHDRTLILVDGVERLLEHSVRDAFSHLLKEVAKRPSLRLLLTCRDYSLETVRSALLAQVDLPHVVFEVGDVTDEELDVLAETAESLKPVLQDPKMRDFLRTPYLLDLAARLEWSPESLPETLRAFRARCWKDLIRDDAHPAGGMPRRREEALVDVARRRATELRPYVRPENEDMEALDRLRDSSVLVRSPDSTQLYAPAHDVWEDWAILTWLDQVWAGADDAAGELASAVGGLPAMRRGLRRWLAERLEVDAEGAQTLLLTALDRHGLPQHFRDDCLASVLLSDSARQFLEGCRKRIAAEDLALLRQVVHLLRVACKTSPKWLPRSGIPSNLRIPEGPGWAPALELVSEELGLSDERDRLLALGFVEDWARQINIADSAPPGADAAGKIVSELVKRFSGYGAKEPRKRALSVMLKIPRHAPAFEDLAQRVKDNDNRDTAARDFSDLIVSTTDCAFACRDFPEVVADVLAARLILKDARMPQYGSSTIGVDECFGVRNRGMSNFFPASALQGPFWALLRHHPRRGIDIVVELLNHAGEWYGLRKWPGNDLEAAEKVTLGIPGDGTVEQWLNVRLFALYRGMSVGPYALQSALMAMEAWFLEAAKVEDFPLEDWLLYVLKHSNNAMASGVVASLCAAHPKRAGRAALALLSCRAMIECDRSRLAAESSAKIGAQMFKGLDPFNELHESDREKANELPHRGEDLEGVAVRLQLTEMGEEVWAILDRHRDELESENDESDDRVWRLALHRMDVRGYTAVEPPAGTEEQDSEGRGGVYFGPGRLEPDVQNLVDETQGRMAELNRHLALQNAARAIWDDARAPEAEEWHRLLQEAQALAQEPSPEPYAAGGPGLMAAVAVRDHLRELSSEDAEWCARRIVDELGIGGDEADGVARHSRLFGPDRAGAAVLPLLVTDGPESLPSDPMDLLVRGLTHQVEEVADHVYSGAGVFVPARHRDLLVRCSAVAVREAELKTAWRNVHRPWEPHDEEAADRRQLELGEAVREIISGETGEARDLLASLDFDTWYGRIGALRVCRILENHPDWEESRDFFTRSGRWLGRMWGRGRPHRSEQGRDYQREHDLSRRIARFVLKLPDDIAADLCQPLVEVIEDQPREVEVFIHDLILAADGGADDSFWTVWQLFADEAVEAGWADRLNREHPMGADVLRRLFLTTFWKDGIAHWDRLDGEAHRLHALVTKFPTSVASLKPYSRFLHTVGQQSLPDAFKVLDTVLGTEDGVQVASSSSIAFYLESLLGRFVYGQPYRLKADPTLRKAVLRLLDVLVSAGSSAAYRMRDDFVTPLRERNGG